MEEKQFLQLVNKVRKFDQALALLQAEWAETVEQLTPMINEVSPKPKAVEEKKVE